MRLPRTNTSIHCNIQIPHSHILQLPYTSTHIVFYTLRNFYRPDPSYISAISVQTPPPATLSPLSHQTPPPPTFNPSSPLAIPHTSLPSRPHPIKPHRHQRTHLRKPLHHPHLIPPPKLYKYPFPSKLHNHQNLITPNPFTINAPSILTQSPYREKKPNTKPKQKNKN